MSERDDKEALFDELWPVREPGPGFVDRVLDAEARGAQRVSQTVAAPAGRPRARRRFRLWPWRLWPLLVGGGLALAALVLVLVGDFLADPGARRGHVVAEARTTVPLGAGTLAVVEPGTELAWSRTGKRLRVDQAGGSVFFRVDRGSDFHVFTPVGQVEVTGTCFRVSLEGGAGPTDGEERGESGEERAAGGAPIRRARPDLVALVEVMEGSVRVRNSHGEAALTAGERGQLRLGDPPTRLLDLSSAQASASAAPASATPRFITDGTGGPGSDEAAPTKPLRWSDAQGVPTGKYFDFSPDERRALARRCLFKWGMPRHLTDFVDSDFADIVFDAETRAQVVRVLEQHREAFIAELRAIYLEVVGAGHAAPNLSAMSLYTEIDTKSPRAEGKEARQLILSEWAGDVAPAPEGAVFPPIERFWRLMVGAQDEIVRRLEAVVGPVDARRIGRRILNHRMVGRERGCPSGETPAR